MRQSSIINILTYELPGDVTRSIYFEYTSRRRELDRIWANPGNNYQMLQDYISIVEDLLAISIFYRHVMGYMQGAASFYKYVNQKSGIERNCSIKVGKTVLDKKQQGYLSVAMINFRKIQDKYQLDTEFFYYSETIQFLRNCIKLFNQKEYEEDNSI